MDSVKRGIEKVAGKIDCNDFNEASQMDAVKSEPSEIEIFTCGSYSNIASTGKPDSVDHKQAIDENCQEHNEENLHVKNLTPEDLGHSKLLVDSSNSYTVGIKNDNFDIFYDDIKSETDEKLGELISFCNVCYQSFGREGDFTSLKSECICQKQNEFLCYNLNIDAKPSLDCDTDSELTSHVVKDETIYENEDTKEQDSAALRRLSAAPKKKMKRKISSEPLENVLPRAQKNIQCKTCSKTFNRMDNFKVHERSHTGEKPFSCGICLKAFTNSSQLTVHGRVHTGDKPFHCEICSKSFSQMNTLKIHVRSHTGEKPYHCKICSKAFSNLSGLSVHGKRFHTVEKPFQCKTCSESFSRKDRLNVHERSHTGEKLLHCKICSKAFISSKGLRVHGKIHTGEKPFHCNMCSKSFSRRDYLTVHERSHTGEKPFRCEICFKRFTYSTGLRVHGKIHKGEN